jgi:hypothetical protein
MSASNAKTQGRPALSSASEYEQTFKTRHRPPGRPSRDDVEPLFPRGGVPDLIGRVAERRAYALVHEKYREELAALYQAELKVLQRRGVEQVAADIGYRGNLELVS